MFGSLLNDMRQSLRSAFDAQYRVWAGLAFMALAMAAIQYDEVVAPKVHGLTDGFGAIASDMRSRISSFTL
jgi:hypothetical protein